MPKKRMICSVLSILITLTFLLPGIAEDTHLGIWYLHSLETEEETVLAWETGVYATITFFPDGTADAYVGDDPEKMTWTRTDNVITVLMDGAYMLFTEEDAYLFNYDEEFDIILCFSREPAGPFTEPPILTNAVLGDYDGVWRSFTDPADEEEDADMILVFSNGGARAVLYGEPIEDLSCEMDGYSLVLRLLPDAAFYLCLHDNGWLSMVADDEALIWFRRADGE